jgi:hypothetical protein
MPYNLEWREYMPCRQPLIDTTNFPRQDVGCVYLPEKSTIKKRFPVTSNLRYMHEVLNVVEIKKLIVQFGCTLRDERFEPN